MKLSELEASDNTVWAIAHDSDFYNSYELLKTDYMMMSADYDKSTSANAVNINLTALSDMKQLIKEMHTFCKSSHQDTETDELMKSLKLMYNSCTSMIKELNKYL